MRRNLKTKYIGIKLDNPIVFGACNMPSRLEVLKKGRILVSASTFCFFTVCLQSE